MSAQHLRFLAALLIASYPSVFPISVSAAPRDLKDNKISQVIHLRGSQVAQVTKDGEVWIGGNKAGTITKKGEIWVGGEKEGSLTKDGEVWKAGEKVGEITRKGAVWKDSNEVGTVEKDGTIWIGSSREGRFKGGKPQHAAVIVFYGFFKLED